MFIDNFIQICETKGLKPTPTLQECGISPSTATNWIKKGDVIPDGKTIIKLANFLNVSADYLLDVNNSSSQDETELLNTYRNLTDNGKKQVIDFVDKVAEMESSEEFFVATVKIKHSDFKVSAGVGVEIGDYNDWEYIEVFKTREAIKADYCLTIKGDSMSPMFENGDVILVKDQPAVNIGDICVYNINNSGYVKKFDGDRLISLNKKYDDIPIPTGTDDIVKCCGLVLGKTAVVR